MPVTVEIQKLRCADIRQIKWVARSYAEAFQAICNSTPDIALRNSISKFANFERDNQTQDPEQNAWDRLKSFFTKTPEQLTWPEQTVCMIVPGHLLFQYYALTSSAFFEQHCQQFVADLAQQEMTATRDDLFLISQLMLRLVLLILAEHASGNLYGQHFIRIADDFKARLIVNFDKSSLKTVRFMNQYLMHGELDNLFGKIRSFVNLNEILNRKKSHLMAIFKNLDHVESALYRYLGLGFARVSELKEKYSNWFSSTDVARLASSFQLFEQEIDKLSKGRNEFRIAAKAYPWPIPYALKKACSHPALYLHLTQHQYHTVTVWASLVSRQWASLPEEQAQSWMSKFWLWYGLLEETKIVRRLIQDLDSMFCFAGWTPVLMQTIDFSAIRGAMERYIGLLSYLEPDEVVHAAQTEFNTGLIFNEGQREELIKHVKALNDFDNDAFREFIGSIFEHNVLALAQAQQVLPPDARFLNLEQVKVFLTARRERNETSHFYAQELFLGHRLANPNDAKDQAQLNSERKAQWVHQNQQVNIRLLEAYDKQRRECSEHTRNLRQKVQNTLWQTLCSQGTIQETSLKLLINMGANLHARYPESNPPAEQRLLASWGLLKNWQVKTIERKEKPLVVWILKQKQEEQRFELEKELLALLVDHKRDCPLDLKRYWSCPDHLRKKYINWQSVDSHDFCIYLMKFWAMYSDEQYFEELLLTIRLEKNTLIQHNSAILRTFMTQIGASTECRTSLANLLVQLVEEQETDVKISVRQDICSLLNKHQISCRQVSVFIKALVAQMIAEIVANDIFPKRCIAVYREYFVSWQLPSPDIQNASDSERVVNKNKILSFT